MTSQSLTEICLKRKRAKLTGSDPIKGGLGDKLHRVAGPIGRAIGWPCLKGDGTTELKPGSPCDKARKLLNTIG